MTNVDEKLVLAYINGEDLYPYSEEELEDDKNFMIQVFEKTNNKKIYDYCSDKVKSSYKLVKYLVIKFHDDLDFVSKVAKFFIYNSRDYVHATELSIIVNKLIKKVDKQEGVVFALFLEGQYLESKAAIQLAWDKEVIDDLKGAGFIYIYSMYNQNEIVCSFFAKRILQDLFNKENVNLEELLHTKFSSQEELKNCNLNTFLLNVVECYDKFLTSYLSTHLNLLKGTIKDVRYFERRWDYYMTKEEEKYHEIIEEVHDYLDDNRKFLFCNELVVYTGTKLGIIDKMLEYSLICEEDLELVDIKEVERRISIDFKEKVNYKKILRIFKEKLDMKSNEERKYEKEEKEGKVLEFKKPRQEI